MCYKFYFSITHTLAECEWAPDQESNPSGTQSQQHASTPSVFHYLVSLWQCRVCLLYNSEPSPGCSLPNCKFKHICFVTTIRMPLISALRLWCVHITLSPHPIVAHPRKNGIHPGITIDITPTTDEYPQLHRQCRHQWHQTFLLISFLFWRILSGLTVLCLWLAIINMHNLYVHTLCSETGSLPMSSEINTGNDEG